MGVTAIIKACLFAASLGAMTACGSTGPGSSLPVPTAGATSSSEQTSPTSSASYPRMGHAPDYSWIAGKVAFTRIQGGCTYIVTAVQPTPPPTSPEQAGVGTPVVGTAVHSDTSPPLRDITPVAPGAVPTQPVGDKFTPGGPGWSAIEGQVKNGDYVVLFGHVAGPDEPRVMCPGGTGYVVDRAQLNP